MEHIEAHFNEVFEQFMSVSLHMKVASLVGSVMIICMISKIVCGALCNLFLSSTNLKAYGDWAVITGGSGWNDLFSLNFFLTHHFFGSHFVGY